MSTPTPINFVLEGLTTSFQMTQDGQLGSDAAPSLTGIEATAEVNVSLSVLKNTFKYWSDSVDVDDADADDIKYYVYKNSWSGDVVDPGEATLVDNPILADATNNKLKHDFVRYLAVKLFNTHHGVDLFSNEATLVSNIVDQGKLVNGYIQTLLDVADVNKAGGALLSGDVGSRYQTNAQIESTNFSRVLLRQMMHSADGKNRFKQIDTSTTADNVIRSIPFEPNDTVSFKLTVNPANNQQHLTNSSNNTQIPGRVYQIRMKLTA
jgi:hypothetical protein